MFINQYLCETIVFIKKIETFLFYKKMNLFAKKHFKNKKLNFFLSNYINIQLSASPPP